MRCDPQRLNVCSPIQTQRYQVPLPQKQQQKNPKPPSLPHYQGPMLQRQELNFFLSVLRFTRQVLQNPFLAPPFVSLEFINSWMSYSHRDSEFGRILPAQMHWTGLCLSHPPQPLPPFLQCHSGSARTCKL